MKLIPLNCFSCGAALELPDNKKYTFCPFCGNKMLIDDEKQRIELSGKVEVSGIASLDRLCTSAETFIAIGDNKNAERVINDIYMNYPDEWRGYFLALQLKIKTTPNPPSVFKNSEPYDVRQLESVTMPLLELCIQTYKALNFAPEDKIP